MIFQIKLEVMVYNAYGYIAVHNIMIGFFLYFQVSAKLIISGGNAHKNQTL